jgi:hypothetical protein
MGSSIHAHIAAAVGREHWISGNTHESIRAQAEETTDVKFVTGHFFWGAHEYFDDSIYFVVLRNPIDRVGSLYDYIRNNPAHQHNALYQQKSLWEILHLPDAKRMQISNGQVRQLIGASSAGKKVYIWHFIKALRNITRPNVVVTFLDQIQAGLTELADKAGLDIPTDLAVTNTISRNPIAKEDARRIFQLNRWDTMLFYLARLLSGVPMKASAVVPGSSIMAATLLSRSTQIDGRINNTAPAEKPAIIETEQPKATPLQNGTATPVRTGDL